MCEVTRPSHPGPVGDEEGGPILEAADMESDDTDDDYAESWREDK